MRATAGVSCALMLTKKGNQATKCCWHCPQ